MSNAKRMITISRAEGTYWGGEKEAGVQFGVVILDRDVCLIHGSVVRRMIPWTVDERVEGICLMGCVARVQQEVVEVEVE